jgi:hypothetical protein
MPGADTDASELMYQRLNIDTVATQALPVPWIEWDIEILNGLWVSLRFLYCSKVWIRFYAASKLFS